MKPMKGGFYAKLLEFSIKRYHRNNNLTFVICRKGGRDGGREGGRDGKRGARRRTEGRIQIHGSKCQIDHLINSLHNLL